MMEPVPWQLKIAFHFYGFGSLLMGLVLFASSMDAKECVSNDKFFSVHPFQFKNLIYENVYIKDRGFGIQIFFGSEDFSDCMRFKTLNFDSAKLSKARILP